MMHINPFCAHLYIDKNQCWYGKMYSGKQAEMDSDKNHVSSVQSVLNGAALKGSYSHWLGYFNLMYVTCVCVYCTHTKKDDDQ